MSSDKTLVHEMADPPATPSEASAYLTIISGRAIGKTFKLSGDETLIGRNPLAEICLDDNTVSRNHARIVRDAHGDLHIFDLQSTNGTWLEGRRIGDHALQNGDKVRIGASLVLRFSYQDELEERYQHELYESATRDGLTHIYNRRFFLERLEQEFSYALRRRTPLSLVIFDIDHFKRVNDTLGHPVGDVVLQELATRVGDVLRIDDIFCRYGGEEFAIVMRETGAVHAFNVAERARMATIARPFTYPGGEVAITISAGIATLDAGNYGTPEALIDEADRQLYVAKQSGRNRVCPQLVGGRLR